MALVLALFFWLLAIVTVGIFLGRIWWLPELISTHGAEIDQQLALTLAVAGITFFLSQIGLGYFIWRYRARRDSGPASYWHENVKLEAGWTIITAIVFIGLGVRGNMIWAEYFRQEVPADALTVEVVAQQFAWNIRYAGPDGQFGRTDPAQIDDALANFIGLDPTDPAGQDDIMTQNILAVPVNRPVHLTMKSKDVTHSLFVPQLRVKQDIVPGMSMSLQFTATKTGEYEIACTELCGMQHYMMRGRLLVMEPGEYNTWLQERSVY